VFIAVAEETGLIDALGETVLATACRDAKRWVADDPGFRLSVNLSGRQLHSIDLMERIERALAASAFPHEQLLLEVTETSVLSQSVRAHENLRAIARAGIGLALDDFGTGHSSLAQLRSLHFDVIKLDRGFIASDRTPAGDAILSAVAAIGTATGARVLAEGIETGEHNERVQSLGCGFGQGWHFGRPVSASDFDRCSSASRSTERRRRNASAWSSMKKCPPDSVATLNSPVV
jgi:EAL domain-containing protein (putative c-di-GMP-specific phosphodiesterase class I)